MPAEERGTRLRCGDDAIVSLGSTVRLSSASSVLIQGPGASHQCPSESLMLGNDDGAPLNLPRPLPHRIASMWIFSVCVSAMSCRTF